MHRGNIRDGTGTCVDVYVFYSFGTVSRCARFLSGRQWRQRRHFTTSMFVAHTIRSYFQCLFPCFSNFWSIFTVVRLQRSHRMCLDVRAVEPATYFEYLIAIRLTCSLWLSLSLPMCLSPFFNAISKLVFPFKRLLTKQQTFASYMCCAVFSFLSFNNFCHNERSGILFCIVLPRGSGAHIHSIHINEFHRILDAILIVRCIVSRVHALSAKYIWPFANH